ncbi:MAG: ribose 5-phosphate isomerase B [Desulfovibrio sp.]|uniref:ribose 5-phosphate isomerase B n=1 Tax=Desulfovibrio sp. 7SRBS1 TaxID=3378064 RepID=UPI003B3C9F90
MPTIFIASDHGGFNLKKAVREHLTETGVTVTDLGPDNTNSCDYPEYAQKLCRKVLDTPDSLGILICGTGIGMDITANHISGIRSALCHNEFTGRMARAHNNANVLCMGERVLGQGVALAIVDAFLSTEFEGGRHARRVGLIENNG